MHSRWLRYLGEEIVSQHGRGAFENGIGNGQVALLQLGHRPEHLEHAVHVAGIPQILQADVPVEWKVGKEDKIRG